MNYKWITSTKYKGVRYYQHETRKHGLQFDRIYSIRYQLAGKTYRNNLGWSSEGWTEVKAFLELTKLKDAYKLGEGAISLTEKRKIANEKREKEEQLKQEQEKQLISFSTFWDTVYWKSQQHKSQGSLIAEDGLYRKWLKPVLGDKALVRILPSDLEQIKQNMSDMSKSPSSIKYAFAVVSQVWAIAKREKLTQEESPTKKIVLPRKDNRRERFLTREEAKILLNQLKGQSIQLHDMALLALYCGLRFGEIANLEWQVIDFENGSISIRDPKSRNNRMAFLTPNLAKMLKERMNRLYERGETATGLIFPSRNGCAMTSVSNAFSRTANKLFNENVTDTRQKVCFHTLRHTFASWLVQKGVDLYSVKELMGHADFKMTQRYSHLSPDGLKKVTQVLVEEA